MARLTGQRARSALPPADTPACTAEMRFTRPGRSRATARGGPAAWRAVTPSLAGTPHVRISRDGGRTYPARHARPLPAEPPQPAVPRCRCTIPARLPGGCWRSTWTRRRGDVDRQAAELGQLLERLGARYVADVAPSRRPPRVRPVLRAAALARAARPRAGRSRCGSRRRPGADVARSAARSRPPGSRHKRGGWRLLTMPVEDALAAVEHPNGPEVWDALLTEFAAELQAGREPAGDGRRCQRLSAELDDAGVPWVPRLGGRATLGAELDRVARTGRWDRSRYAGRSEARMAVLAAAAARGWRLADVAGRGRLRRLEGPGRAVRPAPPSPAGWTGSCPTSGEKRSPSSAGEKNVRDWLTSDSQPRPPVDCDGAAAEYGLIRQWVTAVPPARPRTRSGSRRWGRRAVAVRLVLLALGQAAMVSGSTVIEFGTRNLALHSGLSQRTVSRRPADTPR